MKNYIYHIVAVLTVGIWGLTFISTKVLIGHSLSPQEIFLLRFLIAYLGIWFISPRKLFADNWKDESWLFLGGMSRRFILLFYGKYSFGDYIGDECVVYCLYGSIAHDHSFFVDL